jgi:hypothetical protein
MTINVTNFSGVFGSSQFVVSSNAALGTYTTIQAAVTAAAGLGGGTIIIQPGTYTESITWPAAISVQAATTFTLDDLSIFPVIISGNQTFSNTGQVAFESIAFSATSGDCWTVGNSSTGNSLLCLSNCEITASGTCISLSSLAGIADMRADSCRFVSVSGNGISLTDGVITLTSCEIDSLGASCLNTGLDGTAIINNCIFSNSGAFSTVICSDVTASIESSYTNYTSAANTVFSFTAAGSITTDFDNLSAAAGSGYYATGPGGGNFTIGNAVISGSALSIDPAITTTIQSSVVNPINPFPSILWNSISSNQTLAVNNGYLVTSGSLSLALPTTSSVGDMLYVVLAGGTSFTLTQAAGQSITIGNQSTTVGAGGSLASTSSGDAVQLVCRTANTTWYVFSGVQGNLAAV